MQHWFCRNVVAHAPLVGRQPVRLAAPRRLPAVAAAVGLQCLLLAFPEWQIIPCHHHGMVCHRDCTVMEPTRGDEQARVRIGAWTMQAQKRTPIQVHNWRVRAISTLRTATHGYAVLGALGASSTSRALLSRSGSEFFLLIEPPILTELAPRILNVYGVAASLRRAKRLPSPKSYQRIIFNR